jgi:hypothetical protein
MSTGLYFIYGNINENYQLRRGLFYIRNVSAVKTVKAVNGRM